MLEIRKLSEADFDALELTSIWMHKWWGKDAGFDLDAMRCYMRHSAQDTRLPQTYGLFVKGELVGMYQFRLDDLFVRPDIYPWFANLYVDEAHRKNGYGRLLIQNAKTMAQENLPQFDTLYLYTRHIGLYEPFGWEFVSEIDTHLAEQKFQRLYQLRLR